MAYGLLFGRVFLRWLRVDVAHIADTFELAFFIAKPSITIALTLYSMHMCVYFAFYLTLILEFPYFILKINKKSKFCIQYNKQTNVLYIISVEEGPSPAGDWSTEAAWTVEDAGSTEMSCWGGNEHKVVGQH